MTYTPREKFTTAWANAWDWIRQECFNRQVKEDLEDIESELTSIGSGVTSVNSKTGAVTLNLNEINTPTANYNISTYGFLSGAVPVFHRTGTQNTFLGYDAGNLTTSGTGLNAGFGYESLKAVTTGNANTAFGYQTLKSLTDGGANTAIGYLSLTSTIHSTGNTAVGDFALKSDTDGASNTAIGYLSLQANTVGNYNVAIGASTSYLNTGGDYNVSIGYASLYSNLTGDHNVAIGNSVLQSCTNSGNIALGYQSGTVPNGDGANATTSATYNIYIGYQSGLASTTQRTKAIAIGYKAVVSGSNQAVIGGTGDDAVDVGIGTTNPAARFHVVEKTLGDEVHRIESIATNSDPSEKTYQNRVTTTDATQTTLHTFTVPASTTYAIESIVIARRTGGTAGTAEDGARYKLSAVYNNLAGTATIIGAIVADEQSNQAGWDATFVPSGATVLLKITGAIDNLVVWHVTSKVYEVST